MTWCGVKNVFQFFQKLTGFWFKDGKMHLEFVMIFVALNVIEWKGKCIFEPVYRVGRRYEKIETHFSLWFESI
jgi:hypothetical protein